MFYAVDIETITSCNRKCSYCPNKFGDREKGLMDKKLFFKIIDELSEIDYDTRISLHLYGEPLLDKRLSLLVKYVRKRCPKSFIVIYSNGDFLTPEVFKKLVISGVDLFYITQHDKKINDNIKEIIAWLNEKKRWWRKHLCIRYKYKFKDNRGGAISEIAKLRHPLEKDCRRPSKYIAINYKGEFLLCSNDYYAKVVMGDLNKESLMTIWNNEKFKRVRKYLRNKERYKIPLCKYCSVQYPYDIELTAGELSHVVGYSEKSRPITL